jgi:hypothetical protein
VRTSSHSQTPKDVVQAGFSRYRRGEAGPQPEINLIALPFAQGQGGRQLRRLPSPLSSKRGGALGLQTETLAPLRRCSSLELRLASRGPAHRHHIDAPDHAAPEHTAGLVYRVRPFIESQPLTPTATRDS